MKNKTAAIFSILVLCATASFSACGTTDGGTASVVTLSGSTSVQPLMLKLEEAFEAKNADVDVQISGGGSGKGVSDAQAGTVDFGMASRTIKATETGVKSAAIALDGIALITGKACSVQSVTAQEIFDLYVSGAPIQGVLKKAVARTTSSGTRGAFDELIKGTYHGEETELGEVLLADGVAEMESGGLVLTTIAGTTDSIGYVSLGSVGDTVKAISFEGVPATVENVKNGTYALSRPFNLVWKDGRALSENAQKFYDFIFSEEGQAIVASEGYIEV